MFSHPNGLLRERPMFKIKAMECAFDTPARRSGRVSRIGLAWVLSMFISGTGLAQGKSLGTASIDAKTKVVEFKHEGGTTRSVGEVVVQAADGGMLFLTPDGRLWMVQPADILASADSSEPFKPVSSEEILERAQHELPAGFLHHKTAHYVIVYNTSETYARWVGELFERLYRGFNNYWKNLGIRLQEPRFPLVAYVFDTRPAYIMFAKRELGDSAESMIGYYHVQTNRVVTFDLTGADGLNQTGSRPRTQQLINQVLAQPQAERTVATIVHEAVHQLAYNSGLQVRLADNPLWVSEGLAMFFESPDLSNPKGWGTIGKVNLHNYQNFRRFLPQRPSDSLVTLITQDDRVRNAQTAQSAYAESWALTYYLLKTKRDSFVTYMKELSQLKPLGECLPRERLELFKKHFGEDIEKMDQQFVNYMLKVAKNGR